jgi:hypothetical protein
MSGARHLPWPKKSVPEDPLALQQDYVALRGLAAGLAALFLLAAAHAATFLAAILSALHPVATLLATFLPALLGFLWRPQTSVTL